MGSEISGARFGVVVGLAAEARVARRLAWSVAIGGGTNAGAALAAERLVSAGAEALVSFGLAGGLAPGLHAGELVIPHAVIAAGERHPTDADLVRLLGGATRHVLLGADAVAATREAKQELHALTGAAAIDLESGAVARVAARHHLPFAVLRAICDPADRNLPSAALAAIGSQGSIGLARVLRAIIAEPRQLPALFALAADAAAARHALLARVTQIRVAATPSAARR